MIMSEKGRLQIFRELIDTSDWFDADEVKPENGEECLVKMEYSVGLLTYFTEEDKDDPYWIYGDSLWEGAGFYNFDEERFGYFKENAEFWLPIKHE